MTVISRLFLGGTMLAQAAVDVSNKGFDLYALAKDFGLPSAIVLFVLMEGRNREAQHNKARALSDRFQQGQLVELWEKANRTLERNARVITRFLAWVQSNGVSIDFEAGDEAEKPKRRKGRKSDAAIAELPDDLPEE